ncbi:uL30 family ribosomal protein [Candidatus Woesearchaeota archaeon]|nr:uL30 family ribosomal protein [Candidatus Woesearchaeota archaeon]
MVAAVRVRGLTGVKHDIKETMSYLNLHRKNYCVLLEKKPAVIGMLKKAKDFITWGEVNQEVIGLLKKRDEGKKFFRLNPPRKGYGRKGIKWQFVMGGALGYRGDKINDLLKRMI